MAFALLMTAFLPSRPVFAQAGHPKSGVHVYLIRGIANIFSLGMDELGTRLDRSGISNSVNNHLLWSVLAAEAIQNYKTGTTRTIIVIGHSAGADAAVEFVERLGEAHVPVALAITLDGSSHTLTAGNVHRFVNLYTSHGLGGIITKGPGFSGSVANIDLSKNPQVGHFNIDKLDFVQKMMFRDVMESMAGNGGGGTAGTTHSAAKTPPVKRTAAGGL